MSKKQINSGGEFPTSGETTSRSLRYPLLVNELTELTGEILTIIDASVTDKVQNKAVKDLVKQRFHKRIYGILWDYCYRKEFIPYDQYLKDNIVEGTKKWTMGGDASYQVLKDVPIEVLENDLNQIKKEKE